VLNIKAGAANMAGAWFIHWPVCAGAAGAWFIQTVSTRRVVGTLLSSSPSFICCNSAHVMNIEYDIGAGQQGTTAH